MNAKAARWGGLWRTSPTARPLPSWWVELRRRASMEEREEITEEQLTQALRCFRHRIGLGGDRVNPRWWTQLPEAGLRQLAKLLEKVEETLLWPTAVRECIVQLVPKAETADRPITLTQGLYRCWSRPRGGRVATWSAKKAGHWDRAIAGSSALRAALVRQMGLEVATTLKISWIQVLYDIEKFYDHVDWSTVVSPAYATDYPLVELVLGLEVHTAPRGVATDSGLSEKMYPGRSLIAGCAQAIDYSRLTLYDILDRAHSLYKPKELSTWVDDLIHQEAGREHGVLQKVEQVGGTLAELLLRRGFRISPKSLVLAHPPRLAQRAVDVLKKHGLNLTATQSGKDLGIDAHADRRRTTTQRARLGKAVARSVAIRNLVRSRRTPRSSARRDTAHKQHVAWRPRALPLPPCGAFGPRWRA